MTVAQLDRNCKCGIPLARNQKKFCAACAHAEHHGNLLMPLRRGGGVRAVQRLDIPVFCWCLTSIVWVNYWKWCMLHQTNTCGREGCVPTKV